MNNEGTLDTKQNKDERYNTHHRKLKWWVTRTHKKQQQQTNKQKHNKDEQYNTHHRKLKTDPQKKPKKPNNK